MPQAIPRGWRAMTDLVALPKPRFTSRETASIGRQIVRAMAGSIEGNAAELDHFAMAPLGADHSSHPRGRT